MDFLSRACTGPLIKIMFTGLANLIFGVLAEVSGGSVLWLEASVDFSCVASAYLPICSAAISGHKCDLEWANREKRNVSAL